MLADGSNRMHIKSILSFTVYEDDLPAAAIVGPATQIIRNGQRLLVDGDQRGGYWKGDECKGSPDT